MRQFVRKDMFRHFYAIRGLDWIFTRVGVNSFPCVGVNSFPFNGPTVVNGPTVGEDLVRLERMIVAVIVAVLATLTVQGTASATGEDPGMTHGSVEMTHG